MSLQSTMIRAGALAAASTLAIVLATPASAQGAVCGTYAAPNIVSPAMGNPSGGATATACGNLATASGTGSTAVGDRSVASGNFSAAFGDFSAATGLQSTAVGDVASALSTNSVAVGRNANVVALATNGTALGSESLAGQVNA